VNRKTDYELILRCSTRSDRAFAFFFLCYFFLIVACVCFSCWWTWYC